MWFMKVPYWKKLFYIVTTISVEIKVKLKNNNIKLYVFYFEHLTLMKGRQRTKMYYEFKLKP